MSPKYQNAGLVARQDNTYIPKPAIPKRINRTPKPQPVISQDNRSKWQRKQDSDRGDKEYNRYMEAKKTEEGLHNLNGFLNFADYAGLATGIGGLASKGLKWGAKKLVRRIPASMTTPSSPVPRFNISAESMPSYAKPNWQGDALELTKDRLRNGGFDRLENLEGGAVKNRGILELQRKFGINPRDLDPSYNDLSFEGRNRILSTQPRTGNAKDFSSTPGDIGITNRSERFYTNVFNDAPAEYKTLQAASDITAHEFSHFAYNPNNLPNWKTYFPTKGTHKDVSDYLIGSGKTKGMELTARGTQLKNYFGLKEGEPITEDMLKYAAENYIKDRGYDNVMGAFFDGIKDYKSMAEWLTKFSPIAATPLISNKK